MSQGDRISGESPFTTMNRGEQWPTWMDNVGRTMAPVENPMHGDSQTHQYTSWRALAPADTTLGWPL